MSPMAREQMHSQVLRPQQPPMASATYLQHQFPDSFRKQVGLGAETTPSVSPLHMLRLLLSLTMRQRALTVRIIE
jgi:hypothetical protein